MLITELKPRETIESLVNGKKVFMINCQGCKEVHFPEKEAKELQKELEDNGSLTGLLLLITYVIRKIWSSVSRII